MAELETTHRPSLRSLLLILFFFSGIAALFYQLVWLKYLGLIFGNTVYATATLLAIYLAGLGIGGAIFSRVFRKAEPLLVYAVLEAATGLIGAFSPNAFALLERAYIASFQHFSNAPLSLAIARALVVSFFLLPPTILMGGTLPVLVRWVDQLGHREGAAISSLYAVNTFGACAGVAISGFFTIPTVGLLSTIFGAVALNFLLALTAGLIGYFTKPRVADELPAEEMPHAAVNVTRRMVLFASFLMGLTSIADEVFWSRVFVLHLGSSVYAYALMLFSFLIGIAIGSALIYPVIQRIDGVRWIAFLEIALASALALQIHYLGRFADVLEEIARAFNAQTYNETLVTFLLAVLSAILIPTVIMGATFPLMVRLFEASSRHDESRATGSIYFVNTLGSIFGSLFAGFVLIRAIGSQNGLFLMAAINLAIGATFAFRADRRRSALGWTGGAAVLVVAAFFFARPDQVILSAGMFADEKAPILLFREDVTATVTLRKIAGRYLSLELNGVNVAGTSPELIGTQKLQGHIPLLLHPNAKKVLHIGFGSGGTAYAVSRHPVDQIRIAEISPEVLQVSGSRLQSVNHGVLHDPRVKVEINDGRNFVLATPEKFDIILSDSIHPRYAGNGSLYTEDYFQLCRRKLAPDGIVSMWLPMYSLTTENFLMILRAFRDVFPNTTVWYVPNVPNSFTIVIGRTEAGPIPLDRIRAGLTPAVRAELDSIGIHDEYDIAGCLLLGPEAVFAATRGVPPHIDDVPSVEYESGRLIDRQGSWLENFALMGRWMSPLRRAFIDTRDPQRLEKTDEMRRARYEEHWKILLAYYTREMARR